jgi:hypothetical protein
MAGFWISVLSPRSSREKIEAGGEVGVLRFALHDML